MKPHGRSGRRIAIVASALLLLSAMTMIFLPREASAHPLGNFTVNHYSRISLGPEQVFVRYVLDMAEIPAFREIRAIDADGNDEVGNDESTAYLDEKVRGLTGGLLLTVNDSLIELRVLERGLEFPPGQGGLRALRLSMLLSGAIPQAGRDEEMELYYRDDDYTQQAGWREIVVEPREGVVVIDSTAPQTDTSNELRNYPKEMTRDTPDQREARTTMAFVAGQAGTGEADASRMQQWRPQSGDLLGSLVTSGNLSLTVIVVSVFLAAGVGASRVPGSGVRGRGSGERETTASSLAGKEESSRKEDNSGQGKDGPAGAIAQGGNGR